MTRRANGDSTEWLGSDGLYHVQVTVGVRPDGKPDRRHRAAKTKTELARKRRDLERLRDQGAVPAAGRWTVASWFTHWTDVVLPETDLEPDTIRSYRGHLRTWIEPNLGRLRLDRLRPEHLEALYAEMRRQGRAAGTRARVHATIRRALNVAMARGLVARNVATLVQAPQGRPEQTIAPFSQADARAVLEVARAAGTEARWLTALVLGMRQGECLGLDWRHVDLGTGVLKVEQQLKVRAYQHGCGGGCPEDVTPRHCPQRVGGMTLKEPKQNSKRTLLLPEPVLVVLREHRAAWLRTMLAAGDVWDDTYGALVFSQPNGRPLQPSADRKAWKQLLREAGVPEARLHDARHTAGTLLREMGADLEQVKEWLGHSQLSITSQYYLHATPVIAQDTADRIGRAFWDQP